MNDLAAVFAGPQVAARGLKVRMQLGSGQDATLIGNPLKMSETPVTYQKAPPGLGQDTGAVLARLLGLEADDLQALAAAKVIEGNLGE